MEMIHKSGIRSRLLETCEDIFLANPSISDEYVNCQVLFLSKLEPEVPKLEPERTESSDATRKKRYTDYQLPDSDHFRSAAMRTNEEVAASLRVA